MAILWTVYRAMRSLRLQSRWVRSQSSSSHRAVLHCRLAFHKPLSSRFEEVNMAYPSLQQGCLALLSIITLTSANLWVLLPPGQASESWWDIIFRSPPPDPPKAGGSRGDDFCAISPPETPSNTTKLPLVSTHPPTLVWQGNVRAVELRRLGQSQPLWTWDAAKTTAVNQLRPVPLTAATVYHITANVELQPGQQYEWQVKQPLSRGTIPVRFAVISAQQQAEIERNLLLMANHTEAQMIRRADDFASQQLWGDFWREVLSIEHPSDQLNQALGRTISNLCSPPIH
jgi:hypothetical protein